LPHLLQLDLRLITFEAPAARPHLALFGKYKTDRNRYRRDQPLQHQRRAPDFVAMLIRKALEHIRPNARDHHDSGFGAKV